jgi:integrase
MANGNEGGKPALGNDQARKLLEAPAADTFKGVRDRAILATLLYHDMRREELCGLRIRDMQSRQGVMHFRVRGKRGKVRFVPVHVLAQRLIEEYLAVAGPWRRCRRPRISSGDEQPYDLDRPLDLGSVYHNIVLKYGLETGSSAEVNVLCVRSLRATAAINARYRMRPISRRSRSGSATSMCPPCAALRSAQDAAGG